MFVHLEDISQWSGVQHGSSGMGKTGLMSALKEPLKRT